MKPAPLRAVLLAALFLSLWGCRSETPEQVSPRAQVPPATRAPTGAVTEAVTPVAPKTDVAGEKAEAAGEKPGSETAAGAACPYGEKTYSRTYSAAHMKKNPGQRVEYMKVSFDKDCKTIAIHARVRGQPQELSFFSNFFVEGMYVGDSDSGNVIVRPAMYDGKEVVYLRWKTHLALFSPDLGEELGDFVSLAAGSDDDNFRLYLE